MKAEVVVKFFEVELIINFFEKDFLVIFFTMKIYEDTKVH